MYLLLLLEVVLVSLFVGRSVDPSVTSSFQIIKMKDFLCKKSFGVCRLNVSGEYGSVKEALLICRSGYLGISIGFWTYL